MPLHSNVHPERNNWSLLSTSGLTHFLGKPGKQHRNEKGGHSTCEQSFVSLAPLFFPLLVITSLCLLERKSQQYKTHTKLKLYKSCVLSTLLYGSECWRMTEKDISKLSSFHTKNLRKIVRIFWPQIISNQDLFDEYQQESIETTIARRRWRWIGHILRKDQGSIPRVAVEWKPEGHRKRGRPKMTWRRTVEAEAKAMGHSWGTLRTLAQDRLRWREFVAALVVYDKKGSK